jgi:hypothetical protein
MEHSKGIHKGLFIAKNAHIKKLERFEIHNLIMYLKLLDKQEQINPKSNRWEEIIKIWAEINEL